MTRTTLKVDGMSCGHCVAAVTRALEAMDGVRIEHVEIGTATVDHDAALTTSAQIIEAVSAAGYSASPAA